MFHDFYSMLCRVFLPCHDEAARFVKLAAKPGCNYLEEDDFFLIIQVGFHQKNKRATRYIVQNFVKVERTCAPAVLYGIPVCSQYMQYDLCFVVEREN